MVLWLHVQNSQICRVRVDQIGRDCELEISEILLMVDPRGGGGGGGGGGESHRVGCGCTV